MEVIGHRGCGEQYPENTVRAIEQASQYLATIEVDVRRCRSGEIVVFHDETVDRLTEATGPITGLPWSELRDLEVLDSGETVPRLVDVLEAMPADITAQVELKQTGMAEDVLDIVADAENDIFVSSFDAEALAEVREHDPDLSIGYLFESDAVSGLDTALDLDADAVHPYFDLCVESDIVNEAHDEGLDVIAWKAARTEEDIETMRAIGVDGITADRWDIA